MVVVSLLLRRKRDKITNNITGIKQAFPMTKEWME